MVCESVLAQHPSPPPPAHCRAHRQYLLGGLHHDFPSYRSVVHEVTQAFAAASREVLAVEAELAGPRAQPVLARHVRSLQELEQTRLATVRPPPLSFRVGPGPTHSHPPDLLFLPRISMLWASPTSSCLPTSSSPPPPPPVFA